MIKANEGRILIEVDIEKKNFHTFSDGTKIRLERKYNNFNRAYTQPINANVIEGDNIPFGTEVLVHHNALSDTNRVHNFVKLSGDQIASNIQHYSVPIEMVFGWKDADEWKPCSTYCFGLRVYRPYSGILQGIEPTRVKNVLYCYTGEMSGKVVQTLHSCDYQIIFQGENGREQSIIRFRHYEDEDSPREECLVIRDDLTELIQSGELYIGLNVSDARPLPMQRLQEEIIFEEKLSKLTNNGNHNS